MGYLNNGSTSGGGGGNASWDVTDISASVASVSQSISSTDSRTIIKCTDWVKSSGASIGLELKLAGVSQTLDYRVSDNSAVTSSTNDATSVTVGQSTSTAISFQLEVIKNSSGYQVWVRQGRAENDNTAFSEYHITTQTAIDEIVLTPTTGTIDGGKIHVQTLGE